MARIDGAHDLVEHLRVAIPMRVEGDVRQGGDFFTTRTHVTAP